MKNLAFLIVLLSLFAALMQSCDKTDTPKPDPEPEVETYPLKASRSVLVYMVANNNLGNDYSRYDRMDSAEMRVALDTVKNLDGELLLFRAPYKKTPVLLRMRSGQNPDTLVVYDNPEFRCLTEAGMKQVLDDSRRFVEAPEHGIVLWSHGTGWVQDGIEETSAVKRSYGIDGSDKMNVTSLAAVLKSGYKYDWLYFDCCFMNSIEVAYELREAVPLIVGSVTELPAEGMPYQLNVPEFLKRGGSDPLQAAKNTFAWYDALVGMDRTCTMSVIRTAAIPRLAAAVKDIYELADPELPLSYTPQRFENTSLSSCRYFDLGNYIEALCLDTDGFERFAGAKAAYGEFQKALSEVVVYNASTPMLWNRVPLTHVCGLSTYILRSPENITNKNYDTLSWYSDVASALNIQ